MTSDSDVAPDVSAAAAPAAAARLEPAAPSTVEASSTAGQARRAMLAFRATPILFIVNPLVPSTLAWYRRDGARSSRSRGDKEPPAEVLSIGTLPDCHTARVRLTRQCRPQGAKPGFVIAPLVHRLGEDRLANLLGAGGAHRPRVGVEVQAGRLEGQAAIGQQAADLAFRVVHQGFVDDPVNAPGQDGVEMGHQRLVV